LGIIAPIHLRGKIDESSPKSTTSDIRKARLSANIQKKDDTFSKEV
jgi:hypothetical protein